MDELKELREEGKDIAMAGDGKYDSPGTSVYWKFSFLTIHFKDGQQSIVHTSYSPSRARK